MAAKDVPVCYVSSAHEAAEALAVGHVVALGRLSMLVTHDFCVAVFVSEADESVEHAQQITSTIPHDTAEHTPEEILRRAAEEFVKTVERFESDGTFVFSKVAQNPNKVEEERCPALRACWLKDQAARKRAAKRLEPPPPATRRGRNDWTFDADALCSWAALRRKAIVSFVLPIDPERLFAFDAGRIARCSELPSPCTCWLDDKQLHFRWHDGKGGINLWPRVERAKYTDEIVRIELP